MGLHIESGPLKVERLNHPDDIYIYFEVGYTVWNYTRSEPLGIWWEHNEFFLLSRDNYGSVEEAYAAISNWIWSLMVEKYRQEAQNYGG
jgi:hypothetical protein